MIFVDETPSLEAPEFEIPSPCITCVHYPPDLTELDKCQNCVQKDALIEKLKCKLESIEQILKLE